MEGENKDLSGANEMVLFHGTDKGTLEKIKAQGFNRSYCKNHVVYGKGVYFARDASYSVSYARPDSGNKRYMFVCRVLLGEVGPASSADISPPLRSHGGDSATNPKPPYVYYDSTGSPNKDIFVIYNDAQAIPVYVIEFTST